MTSILAKPPGTSRSFAAMRHPGYRAHFTTFLLAMMADNIEHVISYWMLFQKFHSPALGGFAVLSHWIPPLLFSLPVGALTDRFDPRRIIQLGMLLFMTASFGWFYFFLTDTLQIWHAMLLLVIHGCAGVLWSTPSQMLLHDIVPGQDLQSAVRLNATARYLGMLAGPAVGGVMLLGLGATYGMLFNTLFYLPLLLWLWKAPYGPRFRHAAQQGTVVAKRAMRGPSDIAQALRDITAQPVVVTMTLMAGAASFFIGNSYQAQMPSFAQDLGHGNPGVAYSMLLAADAAGALTAGFVLESTGLLRPNASTALMLAIAWCAALGSFALTHTYPLALVLLFIAGFFELSFGSMAQTLVQMNAPTNMRGRVIGLFNMSAMGLRAFSGITVGLIGTLIGVRTSLAGSALLLLILLACLLVRTGRRLS